MGSNTNLSPMDYLNSIIAQPLVYAMKSPDTELYDFGFGEPVLHPCRNGDLRQIAMYSLHALCRFELIDKTGSNTTTKFYEDTPSGQFQGTIAPVLGRRVKRIALSEKNDLWIDFGEYWIVFVSFENEEESWRFFSADREMPHLVASNIALELVY